LQTKLGESIAEGSLAAIKAGTYIADIYATAQVEHFSYWNVDYPVDSKGCITEAIVDEKDRPIENATIVAEGLTYVGSSMPVISGADGRFCTEAMRSERDGESVDYDDKLGEPQRVAIVATHAGATEVTATEMPKQPASCGGSCLDLGPIRLK